MNWKFLSVLAFIGGFIGLFAGCSKQSEDKLGVAPCDTTNVRYSVQIVSILQNNCYACHGASSNSGSGGIVLEGYTFLKVYADNGYLLGNVSHAPGYIGMPYGLPKLPDCEINTIAAWVHHGSPNN